MQLPSQLEADQLARCPLRPTGLSGARPTGPLIGGRHWAALPLIQQVVSALQNAWWENIYTKMAVTSGPSSRPPGAASHNKKCRKTAGHLECRIVCRRRRSAILPVLHHDQNIMHAMENTRLACVKAQITARISLRIITIISTRNTATRASTMWPEHMRCKLTSRSYS